MLRLNSLIIILLLVPSVLWAACPGTSTDCYTLEGTTYTCIDANKATVAATITDATAAGAPGSGYGNTVVIPACAAGDCVWATDTEINITKDITIQGAGSDSTYLTAGFTNNSTEEAFFKFSLDATARGRLDSLTEDTANVEVSGIHFYQASEPRLAYKYGIRISVTSIPVVRRIKIHDNKFTNIHRAVNTYGYVHGVFYNNSLVNTNAAYPLGYANASYENDVQVVGSADTWVIEDNTFSFPGSTPGIFSGAANSGASHTVRYNTFATGTVANFVETHSNQGSYRKGGFFTEVYGNIFTGSSNNPGFNMRGGIQRVFYNIANDGAYRIYEEFYDAYSGALPDDMCPSGPRAACTGEGTPFACCTGAGAGETCAAQICADDCYCWKVNHAYFWNNRPTSASAVQGFTITYDRYDNVHDNNPAELVEDREFFNHQASFDGTTGMGCGTAAAMALITPTLTGAGFFVPAEIDAATCTTIPTTTEGMKDAIQGGKLYRWDGDSWEEYYTPLEYPHPLRTGDTPDETNPTVTISTSDPQAITSDYLEVAGTSTDVAGVPGCFFRVGSAPDAGNGTACTDTSGEASWATFTCATSGFTIGANTLYVGCGDAAGNWGSDSITVNYNRVKPIITLNVGPVWTLQ